MREAGIEFIFGRDMVNTEAWKELKSELNSNGVLLVAVSKTKPVSDIEALYALGQRDFGENYVQELVEKQPQLPADVRWHFIGHLQTNKVKYIAPFVSVIHAVDSIRLLQEIDKHAQKADRVIDVLLQLHVAEEETKYGLDETELIKLIDQYEAQREGLQNTRICGLMAMATFTDDKEQVREEFRRAKTVFDNIRQAHFFHRPYFQILSIGMSGDYRLAVEEGSTAVRIGSMLFGSRS
jgi:hypothetical protein